MLENSLARMLKECIVPINGVDGTPSLQRVTGSTMSLPIINEEATNEKIQSLKNNLSRTMPLEELHKQLVNTIIDIKALYNRTHDGFRIAAGIQKKDRLTVSDVYLLSTAAFLLLRELPNRSEVNRSSIILGVMAPAIQDCGKNLIGVLWEAEGYRVVDIGVKVSPSAFLKAARNENSDAVAISCMTNRAVPNIEKFLGLLRSRGVDIPVVIGGIAASRIMAYDLSRAYGLRVYYGQDLNDAGDTIRKALAGEKVAVPKTKQLNKIALLQESLIRKSYSIEFYNIPIVDIIIDDNARIGCLACEGDKKTLCPLEVGFELQKPIKESREYIGRFKQAIIAICEFPSGDRREAKILWENMLLAEREIAKNANEVVGFRLPMTCPLCPPHGCTIPRGKCMFPAYYRPTHESCNINMTRTLEQSFGPDYPKGIYALILAG